MRTTLHTYLRAEKTVVGNSADDAAAERGTGTVLTLVFWLLLLLLPCWIFEMHAGESIPGMQVPVLVGCRYSCSCGLDVV